MGYSLSYSYGDFEMIHSTDEDVKGSMQNGVYATAHKWLMAEMVAFIDSGVLDDEDADAEAAELIVKSNLEDMENEIDAQIEEDEQ